ncbi:MAG: hypothetical protein LN589_02285 [Rickettsia endosymbiont of Eriopis connexa]|nr:hypothetical protein [Rickettsia endosymbiont of Eriopis connexa]
MLYLFGLILWFLSGLPHFNKALKEDLLETNLIDDFEFYKTLVLTPYKFKLLLLTYIFHFIAHLTCKYFVDKQYIEEHNILPLHKSV